MTTFAVLRTNANDCNAFCDAVTSTAVVELTPAVIAGLLAAMDEAQSTSKRLGRHVTLSWVDVEPHVYAPPVPGDKDDDPEALYEDYWDGECALVHAHPFPDVEACALEYCHLVVNDGDVCWRFLPQGSDQEEYTCCLYRYDLALALEEGTPCL